MFNQQFSNEIDKREPQFVLPKSLNEDSKVAKVAAAVVVVVRVSLAPSSMSEISQANAGRKPMAKTLLKSTWNSS